MPLYEYYCQHCDGVFETIRPMREASLPVPCPQCDQDGDRVMSTFMAFTFRDGYPRRLPDKGTYWHLGKEVKTLAKRMKFYEHPELAEPKPKPKPMRGELADQRDRQMTEILDLRYRDIWGVDKHGFRTVKARKIKRPRTTMTPYGRAESRD